MDGWGNEGVMIVAGCAICERLEGKGGFLWVLALGLGCDFLRLNRFRELSGRGIEII